MLKKIGWSLLGLVCLIVLVVVEENLRGRIMLACYVHQLRSQGEAVTLADLKISKLPVEGNGGPALLAAADELSLLQTNGENFYLIFGRVLDGVQVAPGYIEVVCQRKKLVEDNYTTNTWADLSGQIAFAKPALKRVKAALAQPVLAVPVDYTARYDDIPLGWQIISRDVARWLSSVTLDELHSGNLNGAVTNIGEIASLTRFQQDDQLLVSEMVDIAVGSIGLDITWQALQSPGWNDAQLAQLQQAWQTDGYVARMVHCLEMDRLRIRNEFQTLRRYSVRKVFDRFGFAPRIRPLLLAAGWKVVWPSYQDESRAMRSLQAAIASARQVAQAKAWSGTQWPAVNTIHLWNALRFPLFTQTTGVGRWSPIMMRAFRYETQRELTVTAIALKRYQLRHGQYPSSLDELVPEFLEKLSHDWMDGKTLKYRRNADGKFTLYSVGEDGRDDGGDPRLEDSAGPIYPYNPYPWWHCRDWVWSWPASAEMAPAR